MPGDPRAPGDPDVPGDPDLPGDPDVIATLRRPIWALGTLICLAVVVLFVDLGFWQLRRLHERRASNHLIASRMTEPAVDVAAIQGPGTRPDPAAIEYRRVKVTGHWLAGSTVLVRSRAMNEVPGFHVLTTLVLDGTGPEGTSPGPDGRPTAVVVNRGFAPLGPGDPDVVIPAVAPKTTTAAIEGVLVLSQVKRGLEPSDPADGVLRVINRVDVPRLQHQEPDVALEPLFVQQVLPAEPANPVLATLPLPDVGSDGPHLSYAFQWFLFAGVGVVGWPVLLAKVTREGREAGEGGESEGGGAVSDRPPGDGVSSTAT
jgi:surfeit locus 1 family protein